MGAPTCWLLCAMCCPSWCLHCGGPKRWTEKTTSPVHQVNVTTRKNLSPSFCTSKPLHYKHTNMLDGPYFSRWSGTEDVRHLRDGVVTQLCLDYGMIDGAVYFTSGQVLGGVLLEEGDLVNCIAVRDGAQGGWKAVRVSPCSPASSSKVVDPVPESNWLCTTLDTDVHCELYHTQTVSSCRSGGEECRCLGGRR